MVLHMIICMGHMHKEYIYTGMNLCKGIKCATFYSNPLRPHLISIHQYLVIGNISCTFPVGLITIICEILFSLRIQEYKQQKGNTSGHILGLFLLIKNILLKHIIS